MDSPGFDAGRGEALRTRGEARISIFHGLPASRHCDCGQQLPGYAEGCSRRASFRVSPANTATAQPQSDPQKSLLGSGLGPETSRRAEGWVFDQGPGARIGTLHCQHDASHALQLVGRSRRFRITHQQRIVPLGGNEVSLGKREAAFDSVERQRRVVTIFDDEFEGIDSGWLDRYHQ